MHLACSVTQSPRAHRRLATELPDWAPSPSTSWHTATAVRSSSVYSTCTAVNAVLAASFAAFSFATTFFSSEQGNQDKLW